MAPHVPVVVSMKSVVGVDVDVVVLLTCCTPHTMICTLRRAADRRPRRSAAQAGPPRTCLLYTSDAADDTPC
eukprot:1969818-Amphidinium_carterae.1